MPPACWELCDKRSTKVQRRTINRRLVFQKHKGAFSHVGARR